MEKLELVKLCRRAENEFVGMPCGIMDQYISVFGREGSAVRIDCRSLANEAVQLPAGAAIFAVNTMVKHELGASAYRERVRECREAVEAIRSVEPGIESLRDVDTALSNALRTASRRSRAAAQSMSLPRTPGSRSSWKRAATAIFNAWANFSWPRIAVSSMTTK